MDQHRFIETELVFRHRHADGSWGEMVEDRVHPDPAGHDEERRWNLGRIFRCPACSEEITVVEGPPDPEASAH